MKTFQIAVIGSAGAEEYPKDGFDFARLAESAYELGRLLALRGSRIITGGKTGIMEWAARGAREAGGITVGIVRGDCRGLCNPYIDVEIVTNMGHGGDAFIIPSTADGAVVLGGGVGTLKELAGFYLAGKPVIALAGSGGWADRLADRYLDEREIVRIGSAATPEEAVRLLFERLSA